MQRFVAISVLAVMYCQVVLAGLAITTADSSCPGGVIDPFTVQTEGVFLLPSGPNDGSSAPCVAFDTNSIMATCQSGIMTVSIYVGTTTCAGTTSANTALVRADGVHCQKIKIPGETLPRGFVGTCAGQYIWPVPIQAGVSFFDAGASCTTNQRRLFLATGGKTSCPASTVDVTCMGNGSVAITQCPEHPGGSTQLLPVTSNGCGDPTVITEFNNPSVKYAFANTCPVPFVPDNSNTTTAHPWAYGGLAIVLIAVLAAVGWYWNSKKNEAADGSNKVYHHEEDGFMQMRSDSSSVH